MSDSTCIAPGCELKASASERCSTHFFQHRKASPKSLRRRFYAKVDKSGNCWIWQGIKGKLGYGKFQWTVDGVSQSSAAHRMSYEFEKGEIPEGLYIDHACHNPSCVNPDHLRLATPKQNGENRRGPDRDSRTGVRGVTQDRPGKWTVKVGHNKRVIHVGVFNSLEEAEAAAIAKRNELFTHNDSDRRAA